MRPPPVPFFLALCTPTTSLRQKPQSQHRQEETIPGPGRIKRPISKEVQGHEEASGASSPLGRCAPPLGNHSRAMTGPRGKAGGGEGGWRDAFRVFSRDLRGNPAVAAAGLSGRSRPPARPSRPLGHPLGLRPPPPHAEGHAGLPPRSPALSRVLCRPFQGEGEGARRELLQWSAERTLP